MLYGVAVVCLSVVRRRRWDEGGAGGEGAPRFLPRTCRGVRLLWMATWLHLLAEEIADQHWLLAFRAVTAEPYSSREQVAIWTAALADKAFLAVRTLVDRVGRQASLSLQLTAEVRFIRCWRGSLAKPVGLLSVGW